MVPTCVNPPWNHGFLGVTIGWSSVPDLPGPSGPGAHSAPSMPAAPRAAVINTAVVKRDAPAAMAEWQTMGPDGLVSWCTMETQGGLGPREIRPWKLWVCIDILFAHVAYDGFFSHFLLCGSGCKVVSPCSKLVYTPTVDISIINPSSIRWP